MSNFVVKRGWAPVRLIAIVLILVFGGSACTPQTTQMLTKLGMPKSTLDTMAPVLPGSLQPSDGSEATQSEKNLYDTGRAYDKTVTEAVAWGALLGAVGGGAAGKSVKGAAQGAAIGAAAGLAAGHIVAKMQESAATKEDEINAAIAQIEERNETLRAHVAAVEATVAENRQEISSLKAKLKRKEITKAEYDAKTLKYRQMATRIKQTLDEAEKDKTRLAEERARIDALPGVSAEQRERIDAEIAELKQLTAQTKQSLDELGVSPVG